MEVGGRRLAVGSSSSPSSSLDDVVQGCSSGDQHELGMMVEEEEEELRRGPWTVEEDFALINYISTHGEGRWNSLARSVGLKRTGKSCRLRWLNYLRPDVRRGNITLEEQLLLLELHSRWGNRWSKIAQHLPGRTDNEIKNYWRTRVQKHAKQLHCDVNSQQFKDTMRYLWMPRLVEKTIQASSSSPSSSSSMQASCNHYYYNNNNNTNMMITDQIPQTPTNCCTNSMGLEQADPMTMAGGVKSCTTESFGTDQMHVSDSELNNNYYYHYYNDTSNNRVEERNYGQQNNHSSDLSSLLEPSSGGYPFTNHNDDDGSGGLDCFHSAVQMTSNHHHLCHYAATAADNMGNFWDNSTDQQQDQDLINLSQLQLDHPGI